MDWEKDVPQWDNPGAEPPQLKRQEGWQPQERPPADWMNWFWNRIAAAVSEIRTKVRATPDPDSIAARDGAGRLQAADPSTDADAATKRYVDQAIAGVNVDPTRTADDTQTPPGNTGAVSQILSWLANRIKAITGESSWRTAPATTLKAAKTHMDASAPHAGHETPAGAQAKVDAHAALVAPHAGHETPAGAQAKVNAHANRTDNPHDVTADQVGALPISISTLRTGPNLLDVARKVFGRSSVAYNPDTGEEVAANIPRYVQRRGGAAIWSEEATSNVLGAEASSFKTEIGGWLTQGANTIAQSTEVARDGLASLKATYQDDLRLAYLTGVNASSAGTWTMSAWVYTPADWDGGAICIKDEGNFAGATIVDQSQASTTVKGGWARISLTLDILASDLSGFIMIRTASAPSAGKYIYIDAVQFEQKAYPSSFQIGATPRTSESIYVDHGPLGPNWFAVFEVYPEWNSATATRFHRVAVWRVDAHNELALLWAPAGKTFYIYKTEDGVTTVIQPAGQIAFTKGTPVKLAVALLRTASGDLPAGSHVWEYVSGQPILSAVNVTKTAHLAATRTHIGVSIAGDNQFNGAILPPIIVNRAPTGTEEVERLLRGGALLDEQRWPEVAAVPWSFVARDGSGGIDVARINVNGPSTFSIAPVISSTTSGAALYLQGISGGVNRIRYQATPGTGSFAIRDDNAGADRLSISSTGVITAAGTVITNVSIVGEQNYALWYRSGSNRVTWNLGSSDQLLSYVYPGGVATNWLQVTQASPPSISLRGNTYVSGDVYANTSERLATDRRAKTFALIL